MHIQRNIEATSRNRFCCGKPTRIKYYKHVFVALFIQHAKRVRLIVLSCGLSHTPIFFHIIS